MRTLTLLALLAATASPALASYDRLLITQNGATDFSIAYRAGAEVHNYWCAAGRYVTNTLGLPGKTRVYRLSPPPRRSAQGISFTLDASRSSGDTGVTTLGGPGDGSFSAAGAQSLLCNVRRPNDR